MKLLFLYELVAGNANCCKKASAVLELPFARKGQNVFTAEHEKTLQLFANSIRHDLQAARKQGLKIDASLNCEVYDENGYVVHKSTTVPNADEPCLKKPYYGFKP